MFQTHPEVQCRLRWVQDHTATPGMFQPTMMEVEKKNSLACIENIKRRPHRVQAQQTWSAILRDNDLPTSLPLPSANICAGDNVEIESADT